MLVHSVVITNPPDSSVKNRAAPCAYCEQTVFNMPRHLRRRHVNIPEVESALAKGSTSPELRIIVNTGIFNHNVEVLKDGKGEFLVARRSNKPHIVEDYLPCKFCLLFFVKELPHHGRQNCRLRNSTDTPKSAMTSDGRLLLDGAVIDGNAIPELLRVQVINRMRCDDLTRTVRGDSLIISFGMSLLVRLGPKRALDIAQRMRQLARLGIQLAEMKGTAEQQLAQTISGSQFDDVIQAIDNECEAYVDERGRRLYRNPCIALKLGHSIRKLALPKRGLAIRSSDAAAQKEADNFLDLHTSEFTEYLRQRLHRNV